MLPAQRRCLPLVELMDLPVSHRHLHITYSSMKHSDTTFMGMTTSPRNAEHVLDMCAILFSAEFIETHPVVTGNCNGNSALVWDEVMLGAMRALRKARTLLAAYEEPPMDEGVDEALRDYIARREREIPAEDALNNER